MTKQTDHLNGLRRTRPFMMHLRSVRSSQPVENVLYDETQALNLLAEGERVPLVRSTLLLRTQTTTEVVPEATDED